MTQSSRLAQGVEWVEVEDVIFGCRWADSAPESLSQSSQGSGLFILLTAAVVQEILAEILAMVAEATLNLDLRLDPVQVGFDDSQVSNPFPL